MRLFAVLIALTTIFPASLKAADAAKPDISTCQFHSLITNFSSLLSEDQKNYELDLALFGHLVRSEDILANQNQIEDSWKVNGKLMAVGKVIKDQNNAFLTSVKNDILPNLTCECLLSKTDAEMSRPELVGMQATLNQCNTKKSVETKKEVYALPVTNTMQSSIECPQTYNYQNLVWTGDSSGYMHTCFYCAEGAVFYNPFNNSSNVGANSCITTETKTDTSVGDRAALYSSLHQAGNTQEANRLLLVEVEKAYGAILKKYQERIQAIKNAFEDAYTFAKTAYEKNPCNDCFKYAAIYNKHFIVDPIIFGPKWVTIVNYHNGYDEGVGKYIGGLGQGNAFSSLIFNGSEHSSQFYGPINDSNRDAINKYFIESHYIKSKGQSAEAFLKSIEGTAGALLSVRQESLTKYGAKYPFQEMLDYLKKLYGSSETLNTIAFEQTVANKELVKKTQKVLTAQVAVQVENSTSQSMRVVLGNLQKTIQKDLEETEAVEKTVAKLGVINNEISKDSPLKSTMIMPYIESGKIAISGASPVSASLNSRLIASQALYGGDKLSPAQLSGVVQEVAYSLGKKTSRANIFSGSTSTKIQSIRKISSDLENVDKASIEKQSFSEFKKLTPKK